MSRTNVEQLKRDRVRRMSVTERDEFEAAYATATLTMAVGEMIREARESAGITQRDLATRARTSQAAIARLEAGGVAATLTTLQRVGSALDLHVSIHLRPKAKR